MTIELIPVDSVIRRICFIQGKKVILDRDLAELYGTETKQLKRAVRRNTPRFPGDFMFELTEDEYQGLRSQFGTLRRGGHAKYLPYHWGHSKIQKHDMAGGMW